MNPTLTGPRPRTRTTPHAEGCLTTYPDTATGTKPDRPAGTCARSIWLPATPLVIWKIDRLGRNLRDLVDLVTTEVPP